MTTPSPLKPNQIDMSDVLNEAGFQNVNKNQILTFNNEGILTDYKIVRLNRGKKICIVEPVELTEKMDADAATDLIAEKMRAEQDGTL